MACASLSVQQGAFDGEDPLNCNNQGDVKRWLSKYIEDGAPPPAGTTFQLPDRREADPPSSDRRCLKCHPCNGCWHTCSPLLAPAVIQICAE
jgi:hypothetical protein